MKFLPFLPFALSSRIPDFLIQDDGSNVLKFGHSLCEFDECPNLEGAISNENGIIEDDITTTSCSQDYKNSFLSARMDRCEYYNASHSDCVKWATRELESACGGSYNCVETKDSSYTNGWATYWGYSSKYVLSRNCSLIVYLNIRLYFKS